MGNTNSGSTFNDRLPVDYTLDDVDDDGLINLQTYKRRPLREAGLPYRKANSRRVIERAERRRSRAYHSLSSKLNEASQQNSEMTAKKETLDKVWLKQFEVCTSVDIPLDGFKSTKYKNEIRHLLNNLFFKNLDPQIPALTALRKLNSLDSATSALNKGIDLLRAAAGSAFSTFYQYGKNNAFGPGEVLMYYLIDGITLAGTDSSGDLALGKTSYEVKAVVRSNSGYFKNFRISIETGEVIKKIMSLCIKANITLPAGRAGESIPSSALDELRASKFKAEYAKLELEYATLAYNNYFKKHPIVFMDTNDSGGGGKLGRILDIMDVKAKDVVIDRISQGKPKPMVKARN